MQSNKMEKIYYPNTNINSSTENSSDLETVYITTSELMPRYDGNDNSTRSPAPVVKIVKQYNAYVTSNESSFKLENIYSETIGEAETFVASGTHPETVSNEVSHSNSSFLGPDSGSQSGMNPGEQITNRNKTAKEKPPVIMFKWGSVQKPFRCQICDMAFADGDLLRSHLEKHRNTTNELKKPFPCNLCTKSFQSNRSLERHQIIHSGQSQKRCKYCYKVFANKENLEKHLEMHNGNTSKTHSCQFCNEQFTSRKILEKHVGTHWQMKRYKCHVCERSFKRKDGLERHLFTHDLGKRTKHQCVECPKSFSFLFALKRHVRSVHGNEPDGKNCEVCGKFIKNKENIGRHMLLHEGVKRFECFKCGRKFSQKQHVIDHMVIHTQTLPFQCKICLYSFRYRRTLSRHMKKHIKFNKGKQTYECLDCHIIYLSEEELVRHAGKAHYENKTCTICKKTFQNEKTHKGHVCTLKMSDAVVIKNQVNKSTETDSSFVQCNTDASFVQCNTSPEGQCPVKVEDLNKKDTEANIIYKVNINVSEDKVHDVENDLVYPDESIENVAMEENTKFAVKNELLNNQQLVYIVYDDGKTVSMAEIGEVQTGLQDKSELVHDEGHLAKYSLAENKIKQISEFGMQCTSCELENEIKEEITLQDTHSNDENEEVCLIDISEGYPDVNQTDEAIKGSSEKKVSCTYNVVVPVKEDCTLNAKEEKVNFSAERFKLLQSLIDYAEKIQDEEGQSVANTEDAVGSETQT